MEALSHTIHLSHHHDLESRFFEERTTPEAKYQKLYEPLYTKVHDMLIYELVNSIVDPKIVKKCECIGARRRSRKSCVSQLLGNKYFIQWFNGCRRKVCLNSYLTKVKNKSVHICTNCIPKNVQDHTI